MDCHVDIEYDLIQLQTGNIVVILLQQIIKFKGHLFYWNSSNLGDNIKYSHSFGGDVEFGVLSAYCGYFRIDNYAFFGQSTIGEFEWTNFIWIISFSFALFFFLDLG